MVAIARVLRCHADTYERALAGAIIFIDRGEITSPIVGETAVQWLNGGDRPPPAYKPPRTSESECVRRFGERAPGGDFFNDGE